MRRQHRELRLVGVHLLPVVLMEACDERLAYAAQRRRHLVADGGRETHSRMAFVAREVDDVIPVEERDSHRFMCERGRLRTELVELADLVAAAQVRGSQFDELSPEGEVAPVARDESGLLESLK